MADNTLMDLLNSLFTAITGEGLPKDMDMDMQENNRIDVEDIE